MKKSKGASKDKRIFSIELSEKMGAWSRGEVSTNSSDNPHAYLHDIIFKSTDRIDFPTSFESWQRKAVHAVAAEHELQHGSFGQGAERHISVWKTGEYVADIHLPLVDIAKPAVDYQYFHLSEDERIRMKLEMEGIGFAYSSDTAQWMTLLEKDIIKAQSEEYGDDLSSHTGILSVAGGKQAFCVRVESPASLRGMGRILQQCRVFSFDLEMHAMRSYFGITCLMQIACHDIRRDFFDKYFGQDLSPGFPRNSSSEPVDIDFIVDTLAIPWAAIRAELAPLFANPLIVKVCHGARGGDIPALYRDFGLVLVNGFDTKEACLLMGFSRPGLATVLSHFRAPGYWEQVQSGAGESTEAQGDGEREDAEDCVTVSNEYTATKEAMGMADWRQR
jgi:hypothetical protein